jgi:hypothetical protein
MLNGDGLTGTWAERRVGVGAGWNENEVRSAGQLGLRASVGYGASAEGQLRGV